MTIKLLSSVLLALVVSAIGASAEYDCSADFQNGGYRDQEYIKHCGREDCRKAGHSSSGKTHYCWFEIPIMLKCPSENNGYLEVLAHIRVGAWPWYRVRYEHATVTDFDFAIGVILQDRDQMFTVDSFRPQVPLTKYFFKHGDLVEKEKRDKVTTTLETARDRHLSTSDELMQDVCLASDEARQEYDAATLKANRAELGISDEVLQEYEATLEAIKAQLE